MVKQTDMNRQLFRSLSSRLQRVGTKRDQVLVLRVVLGSQSKSKAGSSRRGAVVNESD